MDPPDLDEKKTNLVMVCVRTRAHYPYESRNDSYPLANTVGQLIEPCLAQTAQGGGEIMAIDEKRTERRSWVLALASDGSCPVPPLPVSKVSLAGACRYGNH